MRHWLNKYWHHCVAHAHEVFVALVLEAGRLPLALVLIVVAGLLILAALQLIFDE